METLGTPKNSKKLVNYVCEICAFNTTNKNDYSRHIKTIKHLGNTMETNFPPKTEV